jgi:Glycosyl hydrolases family 2, TIM barrel domain
VAADQKVVQTLSDTFSLEAAANLSRTISTTLTNPRLWNGRADPYLYTVYAHLSANSGGVTTSDVVSVPLGLRYFSVDPNNGFFLNGQPLDLHGVNRHQDRLDKGWAIGKTEHDEDMGFIREIGATAIRLAHYQHDQYFYDLADRYGLLVWAEIPYVNTTGSLPAFFDNAGQQLIELIRQNYNHPSIFFWGLSNEVSDSPATRQLHTMLNEVAHREDPTRLTTLACYWANTGCTTSIMANYPDVYGLNIYQGWYAPNLRRIGDTLDNFHSTYPTRSFSVSEYGAGGSIYQHLHQYADTPAPGASAMFHPEEYQTLFHEVYWQALKTRSYIWGKFVWNMFDFAPDQRNEGDSPGRNDKGLITYDRKEKKDAFYWYKANWSDEPVVYITGRRYDYLMASYLPPELKVYSNFDTIELRVNGISQGNRISTSRIFTWTAQSLRHGVNMVEAVGSRNGEVYTDTVYLTVQTQPLVWLGQTSNVSSNLYGISCPELDLCIVAGQGGTLLKTVNGGVNWLALPSGVTDNLNAIACPLSPTCYAVGENGRLLKTSDGGTSWQSMASVTTTLNAVTCPTEQICYAAGVAGRVLKTGDGGANWQSQVLSTTDFKSISCAEVSHCLLVSPTGVLHTYDGGLSWLPGPLNFGARAVDCYDERSCTTVGSSAARTTYSNGVNWRTPTGGSTFNAIDCPAVMMCFAVGLEGRFGQTPSFLGFGTTGVADLYAISCPSPAVCYSVGEGGAIIGFRLQREPSAISAVTATNNQSTVVATNFASPLIAKVTDRYNQPVSNTQVVFRLPDNPGNAGARFSNGASVYTATSASDGRATSLTVRANTVMGTYTATATLVAPDEIVATFNLANLAECNPLIVTLSGDSPACGTLRAAIIFANSTAPTVTSVITFAPEVNVITLTQTLPTLSAGLTVQGQCGTNVPTIEIRKDGDVSGLVLTGGVRLEGILFTKFALVLRSTPGTAANHLSCIRVQV